MLENRFSQRKLSRIYVVGFFPSAMLDRSSTSFTSFWQPWLSK